MRVSIKLTSLESVILDNARSVKGNVYLGTYIEIDTHIHRVTLGNHSDEDSNTSPQIQNLIPNMGETGRH